jgi:hypothetical protein
VRAALPFLIVLGLLLVALVLPSQRDTSVAAWWARVRYQANFFARAALAAACIAAVVWFVFLPLLGWHPSSR